MSAEDVRTFGPRPTLSKTMPSTEDLHGIGEIFFEIQSSIAFPRDGDGFGY